MIKLLNIVAGSLICLSGCKISPDSQNNNWWSKISYESVEKSPKTSALVIGVENGKKYGHCPGSIIDSNNMFNLLKFYTDNIVLLQDEAATKDKVISELKNVVTNDLAVIFYSGHGGSYNFNDEKSKLEEDGTDEFLCLYDDYLRDDDIWDIISQSSGRIFLIFDCCHSQTMFKLNHPSALKRGLSTSSKQVNMLCWSGCEDASSSYGWANGGFFTKTLVKNFRSDYTYEDLWNILVKSEDLSTYQNIQQTKFGDFDLKQTIFK